MKWVSISISFLFLVSLLPQDLSAESSKEVVYLNAAKVFDSYYKTKEADAELEKEAQKKNKEREKFVEEINKLKDEVALLSSEAREKKERDLSEKMRTLQDFDTETKTTLQRKRNDKIREIFSEIDEIIQNYGIEKGYDFILDDRALLYADESIDVTDEVIGILNKKR